MPLIGQGQELEPALLVEVDEACLLHLLEDLDDMRVGAVDGFGDARGVCLALAVVEPDEHHRWLLSEDDVEYAVRLHVLLPQSSYLCNRWDVVYI